MLLTDSIVRCGEKTKMTFITPFVGKPLCTIYNICLRKFIYQNLKKKNMFTAEKMALKFGRTLKNVGGNFILELHVVGTLSLCLKILIPLQKDH